MSSESLTKSSQGRPLRVLIVEDDAAMVVALRDGFKYEGYAVQVARDGHAALRGVSESDPDLIILDVMLPKMSGLEICRQLRSLGHDVPIIMLTARGQEIDKVQGLKLGADDYVTKPFSFLELIARVEAVLRRSRGRAAAEACRFGDVTLDFRRQEATRAGAPLELSSREFAILEYLVARRGEVVTREQLLQAVWGYESFPFTRTVDVHIAKLRRKIESDQMEPRFIVTVHRLGYKFTG
jgi:DNA-binding response OmpR family regulator